MNGIHLAEKIFSEFQTKNVFKIAERIDITITYAKWFPVTLGEFDRKNKRITVNENAEIPFEKIIAHELGHYFLQEVSPQRHRDTEFFDEEKFCNDFAEELLK